MFIYLLLFTSGLALAEAATPQVDPVKTEQSIAIEQPKKPSFFQRFRKKMVYKPDKYKSLQELGKEADELNASKDYFLLEKKLIAMMKKCNDQEMLAELRLRLAHCYMDNVDNDNAAKTFAEYAEMYPNSSKAPYAGYKSIDLWSKELLSPDRDQGRTRQLLAKIETFLETTDAAQFGEYAAQVQVIKQRAIENLFQSEVLTFYFYLNNNVLKGAQGRLEYIKKEFATSLPAKAADIMVMEYELAFAKQDKDVSEQLAKQLVKEYPDHAGVTKKRTWHVKELL